MTPLQFDPLLKIDTRYISGEELYERVARKAYEQYQQRAEEPGPELKDWLTAERLVKEELLHGLVPEEPLSVEEQ